jgi:IMP dehydrogenase/GMP reductase
VRGANMSISTRLTELLKVKHPILLAPMDVVSDGRLAATVSRAGGFGIIGGGYGDETWLARELDAAGDARVGVGFITWSMAGRTSPNESMTATGRRSSTKSSNRGRLGTRKKLKKRARCSFAKFKR